MRKLLLNCDRVFDVLTRGPFPTGAASDDAVEHHLRACHECRQLAEALQPAVELLHEAIAPDEAAALPEYQGLLMAVERAVATAEPTDFTNERVRATPLRVRRLPRQTARPASRSDRVSQASAARVLAVGLLFAAVGAMLWGLVSTADSTPGRGSLAAGARAPSGPTTLARLDDRGLMTLVALNLPARCFPRDALIDAGAMPTPGIAPAGIEQNALRCCTECHNRVQRQVARDGRGPGNPAVRTVAAMQRSCVACHSL